MKIKILTSSIESLVTLLCFAIVAIVIIGYLSLPFLSYRGPSPIYFLLLLLITLLSEQVGLALLIFSLPLIPALHTQASYIFHPAVPYFIAHPGIDLALGFISATFLKNFYNYRKLWTRAELIPWPICITLVIIITSIVTAISRNISEGILSVNISDLIAKLIFFKHIVRGDPFLPLVDLFTFGVCGMLIGMLQTRLKSYDEKVTVMIPVVGSLALSAIWGIFQSLTKFGLPPTTYNHRGESNFFYGAHGFQPDLHAFGALMLVGTIGLLGYYSYATSQKYKKAILATIVLCWIALLLSKSRASVAFSLIVFAMFCLFYFTNKNNPKIYSKTLCSSGIFMLLVTAVPLFLTSDFVRQLYETDYLNFDLWNSLLSLRPEFHRAAVWMYLDYPIFGSGQGNFIRLSADPIERYSHNLVIWQGDNAHNYFLQTLAELGLVGGLGFIILFAFPLYRNIKPDNISVCMMIMAIFLGNIYSHSLLVRENLIFLAIMVSLLYSKARLTT
jgi:hypothetical protein